MIARKFGMIVHGLDLHGFENVFPSQYNWFINMNFNMSNAAIIATQKAFHQNSTLFLNLKWSTSFHWKVKTQVSKFEKTMLELVNNIPVVETKAFKCQRNEKDKCGFEKLLNISDYKFKPFLLLWIPNWMFF